MVHAERCHGAVVNMNNGASSGHGGPPPTNILLERFPMYNLSKGELHRILRGFPLLKSSIRNCYNRILEGGGLPWPLDAPFSMLWQRPACTMGWRWPNGSISGVHHRLSWLANADYFRNVVPSKFSPGTTISAERGWTEDLQITLLSGARCTI